MNSTLQGMGQQPAAHANRVRLRKNLFGLFGGPLAWYLQLCAGYALASEPCFRGGDRLTAPLPALQWTWLGMILAMGAAVLIALVSLWVSFRAYRRTSDETPGNSGYVIETGAGRTRFLALWGILLASGFALATAMTAVAFITLPRCAG
jgi:hypothetical protein